ncbi:hypothetical protein DPMN_069298 [Dreissena polymorpha]|uniref:Uncharacterized protein n=1 Tax=Dreissena polymorpha TaxID=45954 RepID=A0A9D4BWZ8_DREPO|nr:hypothetical protein DPMN_069298 [Dreissena polymorpha]
MRRDCVVTEIPQYRAQPSFTVQLIKLGARGRASSCAEASEKNICGENSFNRNHNFIETSASVHFDADTNVLLLLQFLLFVLFTSFEVKNLAGDLLDTSASACALPRFRFPTVIVVSAFLESSFVSRDFEVCRNIC